MPMGVVVVMGDVTVEEDREMDMGGDTHLLNNRNVWLIQLIQYIDLSII